MKKIVVFDDGGNIVGVITTTDPAQLVNYPRHALIDDEDFSSRPELWAEVDVEQRRLRPMPGHVDPTSKNRKPKA